MVAMQTTGELGEERVFGIGGNTFDDELLSGDAESDGRAPFEQMLGAACDARRGRSQRRMPLRIHRVLMEGNRESYEEIGQLSRKSGRLIPRSPAHAP